MNDSFYANVLRPDNFEQLEEGLVTTERSLLAEYV